MPLWPGADPTAAWELTSDELRIMVHELGAHISSVRQITGNQRELTVGYQGAPAGGYHGATVGRVANRIADARFAVDGVGHDLVANEGRHQLHGGPTGFDKLAWSLHDQSTDSEAMVILRVVSPDGDQGFPGEVTAHAKFALDGRRLTTTFSAMSSAPTPVTLTTHVYWHLDGGGPLAGHHLMVAADRRVEVDRDLIPIEGPPLEVAGTDADLNRSQPLGDAEIDNTYLVSTSAVPQVALRHDNGTELTLTTDQPGVHVYTGAHLAPGRRGIALEPGLPPNSVNRSDLGNPILRPGDRWSSTSDWQLSW